MLSDERILQTSSVVLFGSTHRLLHRPGGRRGNQKIMGPVLSGRFAMKKRTSIYIYKKRR